MIHLGDIKKMNGAEVPVVDCITGGSPCQDLSIAGKRAGLAGERSGLFMEQMRVVKEMRERDRARGRTGHMVRPRYMVWENVPGAFSSGNPKGADFAAVLEEIIKVCEPRADVRIGVPDKGWRKSGCYYAADGSWSIAWRVHDAQFWGVPQRRKRIALVADFGGLSAPEVLFERKGSRWNIDESEPQREEASGGIGEGADSSVWCLQGNGIDRADTAGCNGRGWRRDISYTLNTIDRPAVYAGFKYNAAASAGGIGYQSECSATLNAEQAMAVFDARGNGDGAVSPTLTGDHQNRVTDYTALVAFAQNTRDEVRLQNGDGQIAGALAANEGMKQRTYLVCGLDSNKNGYKEQAGTIQAHASGGATEMCCDRQMTVRRLTPLECERLQGFPDGWTDIGEWTDSKGKKRYTTDTARYKALGNSIALPFWFWLLRRISAQYERPATLGSLFDGISGFPTVWAMCNGAENCLWSSEVEDFCVAVAKKHFGDESTGQKGDFYEAIQHQ